MFLFLMPEAFFAQVMAPFTPFFCESLYQNLRRALPEDAPKSVHWCDFPTAAAEQVNFLLFSHSFYPATCPPVHTPPQWHIPELLYQLAASSTKAARPLHVLKQG